MMLARVLSLFGVVPILPENRRRLDLSPRPFGSCIPLLSQRPNFTTQNFHVVLVYISERVRASTDIPP